MTSIAGLSPFVYEPLPTSTSIRLLTNLKISAPPENGSESESAAGDNELADISFSLVTVDLNDSPEYDCLSYTWGIPFRVFGSEEHEQELVKLFSKPVPVICNGGLLYVGKNLSDFLYRLLQSLQQPDLLAIQCGARKSDFTWIDAVCIDQTNLQERASQVALMGRVFSDAEVVMAWLGEEDMYLRTALQALTQLANCDPEELVPIARRTHPVNGDMRPFGFDKDRSPAFAIYAFFKRAWFRRAWIIQEAVLAKRLVFMGGSKLASFYILLQSATFLYSAGWWTSICAAVKNYVQTGMSHQVLIDIVSPSLARMMGAERRDLFERDMDTEFDPVYVIAEILDARANFGRFDKHLQFRPEFQPRRPSYLDILTRYRLLESQDKRDKIYAFLGMRPTTGIPALLQPDYIKMVTEDVYIQATWHLLQTSNDLRILSHVEDESQRALTSLPSWVPDLSVSILGIRLGSAVFNPWTAAANTSFELDPALPLSRCLPVKGVFVDTVSEHQCREQKDLGSVLNLLKHMHVFYDSNSVPENQFFLQWMVVPPPTGDEDGEAKTVFAEKDQDVEVSDAASPKPPSGGSQDVVDKHLERTVADSNHPTRVIDDASDESDERSKVINDLRDNSGSTGEGDTVEKDSLDIAGLEIQDDTHGDTGNEDHKIEELPAGSVQNAGSAEQGRLADFQGQPQAYKLALLPLRQIRPGENTSQPRVQTRIEAYWRTLIADCVREQHPAPLTYGFAWSSDINDVLANDALTATMMSFFHNSAEEDEAAGGSLKEKNIASVRKMDLRGQAVQELGWEEPGDFVELDELLEAQKDVNEFLQQGKHVPTENMDTLEEFLEAQREIEDLLTQPEHVQTEIAESLIQEKTKRARDVETHDRSQRSNDEHKAEQAESTAKDADADAAEEVVDVNFGPTRFMPHFTEPLSRLGNRKPRPPQVIEYWERRSQICTGRALFTTTSRRYLGHGPASVKQGDQIWILAGGHVPFVLRPKDNGNYQLVGETYVHGIMHGEALSSDSEFKDLVLE